MPPPD
jgi:hypothetical protein